MIDKREDGSYYHNHPLADEFKRNKQIDLKFNVNGVVKQTIVITKEGLTPEVLIKWLQLRFAVTSIMRKQINLVATGEVLAEIVRSENDIEFEVVPQ